MWSLLIASAFAWNHTGTAWAPEDMPHQWFLDDDVEESLGDESDEAAITRAWDNWAAAANPDSGVQCAGLAHAYMGRADYGTRNQSDGRTIIFFNDPNDEIEPGVWAVTYTIPGAEIVRQANGRTYRRAVDSDIVFNDEAEFRTNTQIEAGNCGQAASLEGVATHEIGHLWGLAHSCEQSEICTEADLLDATMYWAAAPCDTRQATLGTDDITSINALYGPYALFSATTERFGAAPLTVGFELSYDSEQTIINGVEWNFGDGETGTGETTTHEYTSAGQYSVAARMDIATTGGACDSSVFSQIERAYVLVCEAPKPEADAEGLFEMEQVDGLRYQTINRTDLSVYGCVDTIVWEVYKGSGEGDITPENLVDFNGDENGGTSIGAWAPEIAFPEAGSYVVVMNVGGPGGLVAGFVTVDAQEATGCSSVPAGAAPGALAAVGGLAVGLAALRRRR